MLPLNVFNFKTIMTAVLFTFSTPVLSTDLSLSNATLTVSLEISKSCLTDVSPVLVNPKNQRVSQYINITCTRGTSYRVINGVNEKIITPIEQHEGK